MENIIDIDTDFIYGEASNIASTINAIQGYISFINGKINAVSEDFTSANYDRIHECIETCSKSLINMGNKLSELAKFLNVIIQTIDEYGRCVFNEE